MWHIFYKSNKEIAWATNGLVNDSIITEQASAGLSYLSLDVDVTVHPNTHWVNEDGNNILDKQVFNPTFSSVNPTLDDVINVTGIPAGTEVFMDGVSQGTMSDTTLTLTATQAGQFYIKFEKLGYQNHTPILVTVKRYET